MIRQHIQAKHLFHTCSAQLLPPVKTGILCLLLVAIALPAWAQWPGTNHDTEITIVSAVNEQNSQFAMRLIDGIEGTNDSVSWLNPNTWNLNHYPMSVIFDLGGSFRLTEIGYFVGNINLGTDRIVFEYTNQTTATGFSPLVTLAGGNNWGNPRIVTLDSQQARFVRIRFESPQEQFNISEVRIFGNTNNDPAVTETNPEPTIPVFNMPQANTPGTGIQRSSGFGLWPHHSLSANCIDLHDRYWIAGPDAKAYHTWHPAISNHPETGETCDFGHEHGNRPDTSPLFTESGGWPPFGYAAEVAGGPRHEDHVGHKVTVAHWDAAFGNAANTHNTLHAAGFSCDWLSKIHQGAYSIDAFSNHLHEYFLTVRCNDGPTRDTSTAFSIKLMFTYGAPNRFNEISTNSTILAQNVKDPNGNPIALAMQIEPVNPNLNAINSREFSGAGQFIWKQMNEVTQIDLWTENVSIQTGGGSLVIGPYYIVKNPARFYNVDNTYHPFPGQVAYTIDLCYGDDGHKLSYNYCDTAPATKPNWQSPASPYNGTLRAINFKSLKMYNKNGTAHFCTDAYGHTASPEPCGSGQILQTVNTINNYWDAGQQAADDNHYWVNSAGQKIFDEIAGSLVGAIPLNDNEGGYIAPGIGKEWIIDNRQPDDDGDGIADDAHIRGEN
ncbi:MAG TPA: hypothetical protein ENJ32_04410 [Crenotrichaceae bacterium]|nr:hypothetical protein [Crenotrichaceae bacterium]